MCFFKHFNIVTYIENIKFVNDYIVYIYRII